LRPLLRPTRSGARPHNAPISRAPTSIPMKRASISVMPLSYRIRTKSAAASENEILVRPAWADLEQSLHGRARQHEQSENAERRRLVAWPVAKGLRREDHRQTERHVNERKACEQTAQPADHIMENRQQPKVLLLVRGCWHSVYRPNETQDQRRLARASVNRSE